jgi:hypothetical protein
MFYNICCNYHIQAITSSIIRSTAADGALELLL